MIILYDCHNGPVMLIVGETPQLKWSYSHNENQSNVSSC